MRISHLAIAALTIATAAPASAAPPPTSYPVICRVGGTMSATVSADGAVRVAFVRGTTAAMPAAGQCTWIDRGFGATEPNVLLLTGNPAGVRYFVDAILAGGTFYAHIYNNGAGSMVVTRVGP